jgi:cystathionine gamma-synthase
MERNYFCEIPFGDSLPYNNPHAVSVSFPTLKNVIDYEEGVASALNAMKSGYPRFFMNGYVKQLVAYVIEKYAIANDKIVFGIDSLHAKNILEKITKTTFEFVEEEGNIFLILDKNDSKVPYYKDYIRNIGLLISSRKAASTLLKLNKIAAIFSESITDKVLAEKSILSKLSEAYSVSESDILLTNCGMNALFAAYETILELRKSESRDVIVQLGWLYIDTMEIIEKRSENKHWQVNIGDKEGLENWLTHNHQKVAVITTEVTTNPLIQCIDLPWLYALCKQYEIILIVDVTFVTPHNITAMKYCDIAVESLTKFASGGGDVLMGCIVLNSNNLLINQNRTAFLENRVPPYEGELCRMGVQILDYKERVQKISENTRALYEFLTKQSYVKEIYSVFNSDFSDNYAKIRKSDSSVAGIISVVFDKKLAHYYDQLHLAKGPSLGTNFTLAMPYIYLAHYDYIKTEQGRAKLKELGVNPELLRISVGIEPVEKIMAAFKDLQ